MDLGEGQMAATVTEGGAFDQREERPVGKGLLRDPQLTPLSGLISWGTADLLCQSDTDRVPRERRQQQIESEVTRQVAVQTTQNAHIKDTTLSALRGARTL